MNNNKRKLGKIAAVTAVAAMGFGGFFLNPGEFSKAYAADIQVLSTDVKVDPNITEAYDGTTVTNFSIDGLGTIDSDRVLSYEEFSLLASRGNVKVHTTIENKSTSDAYLYAKGFWGDYDFNIELYNDVPEKIIVKSGERVEITMNADFSKMTYFGNLYMYFGDENEIGYNALQVIQVNTEGNRYGPEKYFSDRDPSEVNDVDGSNYYQQGDVSSIPEYEDSYYSIFYYSSPFKEGEEPDPRYSPDAGQFKVIGIKKDSDGTIKTADGKDTLEVNIFKNDRINSFPIGKQDPRFSVDESKVKEFGSNYLGTYTFSQNELQDFYDLIVNQKYYGSGRKPNQDQLSNLIKDGKELVLLGETKERENDLALVRGDILQSVIVENLDMESSTIGFIGISYNRNATIYSTTPALPTVGMRAYINDKNPDDPTGGTEDEQSSDANDLIPELKEGTYKVSYDFKNTGIVPITNVVLKDGDGKVVKDYGDRVFQPQDREVFTTDVSISENFKKDLTVEAKSIYNDEKATYSDPIGANVIQLPRAIDLTTFIKDSDGEWQDANDPENPITFDKNGIRDVRLSIKNTGEGNLVDPVVTLPDGTTKTLAGVTIKPGDTYNWDTNINVEREKTVSADYSVSANGVKDDDPINANVKMNVIDVETDILAPNGKWMDADNRNEEFPTFNSEGNKSVRVIISNNGDYDFVDPVVTTPDGKKITLENVTIKPGESYTWNTEIDVSRGKDFSANWTVSSNGVSDSDPIVANVQISSIGLESYINDSNPDDPTGMTSDKQDSDADTESVNLGEKGKYPISLVISNNGDADIIDPIVKTPSGEETKLEGVTIKPGNTYVWKTSVNLDYGQKYSGDWVVLSGDLIASDPINAIVSKDSRIPEASPDSSETDFNTPVTISPLENDTLIDNGSTWKDIALLDKDGNPVKELETNEGKFVVNEDNTVTFTPKDDFSGEVPIVKYRATDSDGKTADSTISITVGEKVVENENPPVDEENPSTDSTDESTEQPTDSSEEPSDKPSENLTDPSEGQLNDEKAESPSDSESPNTNENSNVPQVKTPSVNNNQSNNEEKVENTPSSSNPDSAQKNETFEKNLRIPESSKNVQKDSMNQKSNDSASVKTGGETVENDSKAGIIAGAIAGIGAIIASAVALTNRKSKENKVSKNSKS